LFGPTAVVATSLTTWSGLHPCAETTRAEMGDLLADVAAALLRLTADELATVADATYADASPQVPGLPTWNPWSTRKVPDVTGSRFHSDTRRKRSTRAKMSPRSPLLLHFATAKGPRESGASTAPLSTF
jgi:hypothetical protein